MAIAASSPARRGLSGSGAWDRMMAGFEQSASRYQAADARDRARAAQAQQSRYTGQAIRQISGQQASARRANIQRYGQMMDIYNKVIARAGPGGAFQKAGLGQIESAKTKGVGQETQSLISGGMFGTTTAAGVGRKWEADVGAPARLRLEDIMEQRLSTAQLGKAGAIERREDVYPDYNALLQMLAR